jgi:hypothetical protein
MADADVADAQDADAQPEMRFSLQRMASFLLLYRMLFAGLFIGSILFAIGYIRNAEHKYTASMLIGPVADTNQLVGGMDFSATSGTGLLSALSQPKVTPLATLKELLHSEPVARVLLNDTTVRDHFFPGLWNEESKSWRRPGGLVPWLKSQIKTMLGLPAWTQPSPGLLQQALTSQLQIADDRETGFTSLSFEDRDPQFAVHLLSSAVATADSILRQRTRNEATRRIEFISSRLDNDAKLSVDHRQVLIRFLASEEQKLIGVAAGTPMAADIVLPAKASAQITAPNWKAVLAASIVLGGFLAIVCIVLLPMRLVPGPRNWFAPLLFAVVGGLLGIVTGLVAG